MVPFYFSRSRKEIDFARSEDNPRTIYDVEYFFVMSCYKTYPKITVIPSSLSKTCSLRREQFLPPNVEQSKFSFSLSRSELKRGFSRSDENKSSNFVRGKTTCVRSFMWRASFHLCPHVQLFSERLSYSAFILCFFSTLLFYIRETHSLGINNTEILFLPKRKSQNFVLHPLFALER